MYKLAKKSKGAARMVSSRGVVTRHMVQGTTVREGKVASMLDVYAETEGHLGIVWLNREHRFNMLTPSYMREMKRGVESMNVDHVCNVIYMTPKKDQHFSIGTDFRTIAHMKKEDNYERIAEYLEDVVRTQTYFAKLNKPLLAAAPGVSLNSGAALLAATACPLMTETSTMAFNEVTFGFTPHSGASFYMSRMPGEFGTFMALTGLPINGIDATHLKIASSVLKSSKGYQEHVSDVCNSLDTQTTGYEKFTGHPERDLRRINTPWQNYLEHVNKASGIQAVNDQRRLYHETNIDGDAVFEEAKDRVPGSVGEAQARYIEMLRKDSNQHIEKVGYMDWGLHDEGNFNHQNMFKNVVDYMGVHCFNNFPHDQGTAIPHRQLIDRCFMGQSVEEIMHALRQEDHPFAKKCLQAMEQNSMLSMKLALQMMRKATNLDYRGCLRMELDVAMNKIASKDFDAGVHGVIQKKKNKSGENVFSKEVESDLTRFFEPSKHRINIDVVENALLPTRMHYSRFSDYVRLWINEESTTQPGVRDNFDEQAKEGLREQGIDVRDKALTQETARNHLAGKLAVERRWDVYEERTLQLMTDKKIRGAYSEKVNEVLAKLQTDKQEFDAKVESQINEIFQAAFIDRLGTVFEKSKEAHSLEKRRMFLRIKKFYFKSRIFTYARQIDTLLTNQLESLPYRLPHLSEKWDKSFREMDHPNATRSPLFYISKAIGRINLAPAELAKSYTTQPEMREKMQLVTFNEEELRRLQKDVFDQPQKYIEAFSAYDKKEPEKFDVWHKDTKEAKLEDKIYWYRVRNDGQHLYDAFPYAMEFEAYKLWADEIEAKALDTLKFAINQLLLEIEESKKAESSKQSSLMELLELANGRIVPKKSAKESKRRSSGKLNEKSKPLSDLPFLLKEVLETDEDFAKVFDRKNDNFLANKMQESAEQELLKLLELVLLDKYGPLKDEGQRQMQEELLAQHFKPGFNKIQHLAIIDNYLSDVSGKAAIQDALELVKPYFISLMVKKVEDEAAMVLNNHFHHYNEETKKDVTITYYMQQAFPGIDRTAMAERFHSYSPKREQIEADKGMYPEVDERKNFLFYMEELDATEARNDELLPNLTEVERSERATRRKLDQLQKFDQVKAEQELEFADETKELRENFTDILSTGPEAYKNPMFHPDRTFDTYEAEHALWDRMLHTVEKTVDHCQYELEHNMQTKEWLRMYADTVLDYGMDMNQLFRFEAEDVSTNPLQDITKKGYLQDHLKPQDEWNRLAEYARYLADFQEGLGKVNEKQSRFDLPGFVATHTGGNGQDGKVQSLFLNAVKHRNEQIQASNVPSFDREAATRASLLKLANLQGQSKANRAARAELSGMVNEATPSFVRDAVHGESKYVDLDGARNVMRGEVEASSVVKTDLIVRDLQSKKFSDFDSEVLSSHIDEASLGRLRTKLDDASLTHADKDLIKQVVELVSDQTRYMGHSDRQAITFQEYLSDYHLNYQVVADGALKEKVEQHFGEPAVQEDAVEWQLGESRTHPMDFAVKLESEELSDYLYHVGQKMEERIQPHQHVRDAEGMPGMNQRETDTETALEMKALIRDAKMLTELPHEMESLRNQYQNELIKLQMTPDHDINAVEELVSRYSEIRLNGCMLNPEFQQRVRRTNLTATYMKMLQERVVDELHLTKDPDGWDLSTENLDRAGSNERVFDLDAAHNMQTVNNADVLGYDNLLERAQAETTAEAAEAAYDHPLDRLLADYFLANRGNYLETNKMLKGLADIFHEEKHGDNASLDLKLLHQNIHKDDEPRLDASSMRALMELDTVTARALQKDKNGLSKELREFDIRDKHEATQIPLYFQAFDARKPAAEYVDDKLREILVECMSYREKLEKDMTRNELVAFDRTLARYLKHENLVAKLEYELQNDMNGLVEGAAMVDLAEARKEDEDALGWRTFEGETQRDYNKAIVNEDAEYKQVAYKALDDIKEHPEMSVKGLERQYNIGGRFEDFYLSELRADAKRPARPINEAEYKPLKPWQKDVEGYQTREERAEEYALQHKAYMEGKKEGMERQQLFYVLEQLYEKAQRNPDPLSKSQEHINEYFDDPENTFFFDKNKIN